jgi:hypothetical protein
MRSYFLNVDVEIQSSSKLDVLAAAMGKRVIVLHSGPGSARRHLLAIESSREHKGPDATIHALCAVVESLPPPARRIWNTSRREFDVGYELRASEQSSRFSLRPDTLERIAKLGAILTVTYYRGDTTMPSCAVSDLRLKRGTSP